MNDEPALQTGDSGDWVAHLQDLMRAAGFRQDYSDCGFGDELEKAVQAMQDGFGLQPTGVIDDDTWSALQQRTSTVTSAGTDTSGDSASRQETTSTEYDKDAWQGFLTANGPCRRTVKMRRGSSSVTVRPGHSGDWVDYLDAMLTSNRF